MISEILKNYQAIIKSYEIHKFQQVGQSYALVLEITFVNDYTLFAKDYLFLDGSRKYAFHFQDHQGVLIFRFDNAPHWKDIPTFPFHKHLPDRVVESEEMNLEKVFLEIDAYLKGQSDAGCEIHAATG